MTIFELANSSLREALPTSFKDLGITERGDLQRLLRSQIESIAPDTFVICEEFGQWEDSSRRIDLLALDRAANLVVVELKRTNDGGHMELQAIRYAAMVSTMTFAQAAEAHRKFRADNAIDGDATEAILAFLGWVEPDDEHFAADVRITLASEDFSREITTAVMWLNERSLDIRCVRMKPYTLGEQVLLDVQQVIPLPEATDYQVRVREKSEVARAARTSVKWDLKSFMDALEATKGPDVRKIAESLLRWSETVFDQVWWGSGQITGSFVPGTVVERVAYYPFAVYTSGTLEVYFQWLAKKPSFHSEAARDELRRRLNCIPGVAIPPDAIARRPNIPLRTLGSPDAMRLLRESFEWVLDTIRNTPQGDGSPATSAD